jgi:fatty-acyl-CoA synthase
MAALAVDDRFDLVRLAADARRNLPRFALPLFLRIGARLDVTGTFRTKKADLARDGFDPECIDDKLYIWRQDDGAYRRLDRATYAAIAEGAARI